MSNTLALQPAISKFEQKSYSLEPDMINGWRLKMKVFKQIPIRFSYQPIQRITRQYTKFKENNQYRVLYLGPRYFSNLKAMKSYSGRQYDKYTKQSCVYGESKLQKYQYKYHKQKQKTFNLSLNQHRIFTGMNPTLQEQEQLVFESDFQCGNLDLVMKIGSYSYDLFMRVDTNTKGHTSWYFFKLKNKKSSGKIVNLNICNFTKKNLLYKKGMKPYIFSRQSGSGWKQGGLNINYQKKKFRYQICEDLTKDYYTLSFSYQFQYDYDQIYFAYCVPYSYSYLLNFIKQLTQQPDSKSYLKEDYHYESPSGLKIPVLTITNSSSKQKKKSILLTARLHPGQPQGSWMIHGFIKYLCSPDAKKLRDNAIFKIVPMVNVDGVVFGNFRTGLKGRDLNRLFKNNQPDKYYQVDYIKELGQNNLESLLMYLDFHGHSTKKSVFIYGPEYKIGQTNYYLSRIMPKMISKATQMFRFYACIFKISKEKESTARAVMFRQNKIPYCYTIEASTHSFTKNQNQITFTSDSYIEMGDIIAKQVDKIVSMLVEIQVKKQQKRKERQKRKQVKEFKIQVYQQIQISQNKRIHTSRAKKIKDSKKRSSKTIIPMQYQNDEIQKQLESIIFQLKNDTQKFEIESQGSSDCEDLIEDYEKQQLQNFLNYEKKKKKNKSSNNKKSQIKLFLNKQTINTIENNSINAYKIQQNPKQLLSENSLPQIRTKKQKQLQTIQNKQQRRRNWVNYIGKSKLSNYQIKLQQYPHDREIEKDKQIFADRQKIVLKQGYVVNIKMQSDEDQQKQRNNYYSIPKKYSKSNLPDLNHQQIFQKKKLSVVNSSRQIQLPHIVSQIVKNHLKNQDIKKKRLNKSIQIIRL